ncbi:hypothetical protein C3L33_21328, partial [Rhododendron williamsianum]
MHKPFATTSTTTITGRPISCPLHAPPRATALYPPHFDSAPNPNALVFTNMLKFYAQTGAHSDVITLFCQMQNCGVRSDVCVYPMLMKSVGKAAVELHAHVLKMGYGCDVYVRNAMMGVYVKYGPVEVALEACELFDLMPGRNVISWTAMVTGFSKVRDLKSARRVFDEMPEKSIVSWNAMISESLVKMMDEKRVHLNYFVKTALIDMHAKCGSLETARKIFDELGVHKNSVAKVFQEMATRDVVSYNTLITGFAAHGHGSEALELIMQPRGLLEEGREMFDSIEDPEVDHYACMVDLLGRVGKLDEAKELIERMPMNPHAGVYGSLLNASRIHKRTDLGELAANILFELEPQNSGNYVLLSNMYASKGRWEDVERVRKAMREGGVKKTTGWSWVEYGGKMHKFIVGDRSHERSSDIYQLLTELRKKMRAAGYIADKSCVLRDVEEEEKEELVGTHSEKLAIAFALLVSEAGSVIR